MAKKYVSAEYVRAMMMRHSFRSPDMTVTEFTDILKSADVRENVKGEWESGTYRSVDHHTGETYRDGEAVICSVCRNGFKKIYVDPRWNFCPNCGADMRVKDA